MLRQRRVGRRASSSAGADSSTGTNGAKSAGRGPPKTIETKTRGYSLGTATTDELDGASAASASLEDAAEKSYTDLASIAAEHETSRHPAAAQAALVGSDDPALAGQDNGSIGDGTGGGGGARRAMGKDAVAKDESRMRKILTRVISGVAMIFLFLVILYMGHVYICSLIAFVELLLFRELVKVRYNTFFHIIEETIPLFRTTQWMWFLVAIFYTYSDFVVEIIKSNTALHHLLWCAQLQTPLAFVLYSGAFVLTIATMQTGHIRFQLNQLCWTIVVLCLTVGQLKYIMHNVYNGLIWFALPILLVVVNDIGAYFAGMTCGRKFIHRPFIPLSPNKTWEGFIGGWIFTMIAGWYLSRLMAQFTWMTCPTNQFHLFPEVLDCYPDPIFHEATSIIPPQIFELVPSTLVNFLPGVVNICSVDGDRSVLTACISGEPTHKHHHFELVLKNVYPIQIHALSLSMFASLVAPFGGFLASAIKRAYGIKDFDSIIPGHGGLMDRMDCQFLMALCTWVHYNTFVRMATVSVPKMIYFYNLMKEAEQMEFLERITEMAAGAGLEQPGMEA